MRSVEFQSKPRSSRREEALIPSRITHHASRRSEPPHVGSYKDQSGSAFIIVLWIAFGLVSLSLYFGNSMVLELRAADNRVSGLGAEQAIEGAVRYINGILGNYASYGSNG